ncbi:hypothetical protein ACUNV4_00100 [Granulosicoccus sp. 3-233]|uniref:hypothetical protein n=1 Tax=Granulosicoccus sp. 3-233 TaxID=3417969 RepID=UPI003D329853
MSSSHRHSLAILLAVSAVLLASLIPGGPIENRDFSHINVSILGGFNLFLTVLNLGTVALVYGVFRNRRWAISTAWFAGFAFFVVYAIDLAQLFPRSPTPMSQALSLIEVLGMCAAVPTMYLSWPYTPWASGHSHHHRNTADGDITKTDAARMTGVRIALLAVAIVLGIGIIFFATDSAMNPCTGAVLSAR